MNVMGNKILVVSNMLVCDVCKRNKATRKITYPTMVPMENVTQFHGIDYSRTVNEYKRNDVEYNICQECLDIIAMNRGYIFQLTKEMIYNKVNESKGNEE